MLSIKGERVCQKRYLYTILGDYSQNKRNYTFGTLFVIKYLFTVFCYGKNSCGSCQSRVLGHFLIEKPLCSVFEVILQSLSFVIIICIFLYFVCHTYIFCPVSINFICTYYIYIFASNV